MSPERFRQIEELYHAAREGTAEGRAALLAETDPELRREVELLLSQQASGGFLDRPAIRDASELFEDLTVTRLDVGACLGPYRIERKLGEGGMGEVFRAVDKRLGRAVAIKTAHKQFSPSFEREARAIASLNHPHICTVYDIGPNYLVMELVEGETLGAKLKTGPLPVKTLLLYASQIAAALAEAHSKGIIHRDLKPGNIMIGKSGAKVLDFGLAKSVQDETVTASHNVMGTPAYMAPEQWEGKPADARSDIYSFGCLLYEMSTGDRISPHRERLLSRKLERIVRRCLEKDPGRRWQSVADLEKELAPGASDWGKLVPAAMVMTMALLGATYFYLHRTPRLTDKDTIVLADFVNETGDRVFDGTLREALAIQLEESPFLKVLDESQVRQDLQLMRKSRDESLTKELGREICQRENEKAMISGTIASLGKAYVITVAATNCESGATLARQQAQVPDKEHALDAVSSIAKKVRENLGESLASIQSMAPPNERVTTTSLEAFRAFAIAAAQFRQGHYLAAIPILRRAVELDPGFSTAWLYLGTAYQLAGDRSQQHQGYSYQKAFDLRNQASERERLLISTFYYYTWRTTGRRRGSWRSCGHDRSHVSICPSTCRRWCTSRKGTWREACESSRRRSRWAVRRQW
jgi:predicted Ser/Thr protein kinase